MTPAARINATISLLDEVRRTAQPADALVSQWFRSRRYIGAKDRAAISQTLYDAIRHHARLGWWLERVGMADDPRGRTIAYQMLVHGRKAESLAKDFSGGQYCPPPFSEAERRAALALEGHTANHPGQPEAITLEVPGWMEASLREALGRHFASEMRAMLISAPLDLRVNPVRMDRGAALATLAAEGIPAQAMPLSPWGIRVHGRPPVTRLDLFQTGAIEIQDEGSQLVAFLVGARPGHRVVDFCAGAGGKTLAMAAAMGNRGRIIATDVLEKRLRRSTERFRRAGLHNIETRALSSARDPWIKRHKDSFDRVLVDVPCSGTGTWRRNPDARWRPMGPGLERLLELQKEILESAARLVAPGGRLVYATCSLLDAENTTQIDCFLATHPEFSRVPLGQVWSETLSGPPPSNEGPDFRLFPGRDNTDGFYAAILARQPTASPANSHDLART